ncbi:MAG TPA: hypothetical protein VL358_12085 [Caulobacteraceae bacterium]|jgi:hypothetical protein|nr:hypothetical protein [Caulobacteraceae bacterium]
MRRLIVGLSLICLLAGPVAAAPADLSKPPAATLPRSGPKTNFPLARATPDEVKAWLGEPAVANEEGKGAFWTYRLEDCALMVFFKDAGSGLRVSGVATGPRRRAEAAPDPDTCITNARR